MQQAKYMCGVSQAADDMAGVPQVDVADHQSTYVRYSAMPEGGWTAQPSSPMFPLSIVITFVQEGPALECLLLLL